MKEQPVHPSAWSSLIAFASEVQAIGTEDVDVLFGSCFPTHNAVGNTEPLIAVDLTGELLKLTGFLVVEEHSMVCQPGHPIAISYDVSLMCFALSKGFGLGVV